MLDDFTITDYNDNLDNIIDILKTIKENYPDYDSWIENTVSVGIINGTRKIRVLYNEKTIAGLTILKNTPEEKKLCSLFITPEYRGESWMYSLFKDATDILETNSPAITIPSSIIKRYNGLIFSNKWKVTSKIDSRYSKNIIEYGFNET